MFIFEELGLKTIKTPQNPIIIAIQLMKLSFSFKINFAKISRKKGEVISSIVKRLIGICCSEKKTIKGRGIKLMPLNNGK